MEVAGLNIKTAMFTLHPTPSPSPRSDTRIMGSEVHKGTDTKQLDEDAISALQLANQDAQPSEHLHYGSFMLNKSYFFPQETDFLIFNLIRVIELHFLEVSSCVQLKLNQPWELCFVGAIVNHHTWICGTVCRFDFGSSELI